MMQIASIRQIELLAMLALPLRRTLHRQTQEFESPLIQALLPPEIEENRPPQRKKTKQGRTKRRKVLGVTEKKTPAPPYPLFKPLSSSGYQIAALKGLLLLRNTLNFAERTCLGAKRFCGHQARLPSLWIQHRCLSDTYYSPT